MAHPEGHEFPGGQRPGNHLRGIIDRIQVEGTDEGTWRSFLPTAETPRLCHLPSRTMGFRQTPCLCLAQNLVPKQVLHRIVK